MFISMYYTFPNAYKILGLDQMWDSLWVVIHNINMQNIEPWKLWLAAVLQLFDVQRHSPEQGHLKIWRSDSHWFSLSLKQLEISLQKFQHTYNSCKNGFWQNLEGVAQKLNLPHPFDVFNGFGRKSKFCAPRTFIFNTKQVLIEFDSWWKFGDDISNHLWEIQN